MSERSTSFGGDSDGDGKPDVFLTDTARGWFRNQWWVGAQDGEGASYVAPMFLLLSAAFAATVAVLPLDQGAGGDPYQGLGIALAGMLTTDLSSAPGLTLVERARLDAVTEEIALGKGGFVDPATAQKLGRGVGAEYVVIGSYSVVGETFLLDARLVSVARGNVAKAASANGSVATFVDVERELVGELLDGLDVKLAESQQKTLAATAPTRSFTAFAAYGKGAAAETLGSLDAARAAYAEALTADPAYAAPTTALSRLRTALDTAQVRRAREAQGARTAVLDKVLAAFPEPTTRPDEHQTAGFILRLLALREQGRDCERYAEMRRYLDTVGWRFVRDHEAYAALATDAMALGVEVGFAPSVEADAFHYHAFERSILSDGAPIFRSTAHYFYQYPTVLVNVANSPDLTMALARCLTPPEQVVELARLSAQARAYGAAGMKLPDAPVLLSDRLEWSMIAVRARSTGVDEGMAARITSLIATEDDTTPRKSGGTDRSWIEKEARQITDAAAAVDKKKLYKLGWTDEAWSEALEAMIRLDPKELNLSDPNCKAIFDVQQRWATEIIKQTISPDIRAMLMAPRDLGCFTSTKARFAKLGDAVVFVAGAPARAIPEHKSDKACVEAFAELPERLEPAPPQKLTGMRVQDLLSWYYVVLVLNQCVPMP